MKMQMDDILTKKIQEQAEVKLSYRIKGQDYFIRGYLINADEESFSIQGKRFGDTIAVPRKGLISMIFQKKWDKNRRS